MLQLIGKEFNHKDTTKLESYDVLTERVKKRRLAYRQAAPKLMPERSRLFRESWQKTENAPLQIRFAKAFQNILESVPVTIREAELLVGSPSSVIRGCYASPEFNAKPFIEELNEVTLKLSGGYEILGLDKADRESILEDAKYWNGKTVIDKTLFAVRQIWGDFVDTLTKDRLWTVYWPRTMAAGNVDYPKILKIGFNGLIKEIKDELRKIKNFTPEEQRKYNFLHAGLICCEAIIQYAKRHAQLAKELAENEKNPLRKRELEEISEICERVPANPARNLREALQSYWFQMLGVELESAGQSPVLGRWDQIFYDYYAKDIDEGLLSRSNAAELFALLFIKFNELEDFRSKDDRESIEGTHLSNLGLAGVTKKGEDATNALSFLLLDVTRELKVPQPAVSIQLYNVTNEDFLLKALETTREHGGGIPQYLNGEIAERNLVEKGVALEDAREWVAVGCVEHFVFNKSWFTTALHLNLPKVLELTLNNGVNPTTGKQIGLQTGYAKNFTSYAQFYAAYKKQITYLLEIMTRMANIHTIIRKEFRTPYSSLTFQDCMQNGLDKTEGGRRYYVGECFFCPNGHQNAADSLTAIKKLIFEDGSLSMATLLEALECNFDGMEDVRHLLLSAPKYGNDDDYADSVMEQLWDDTKEITYQQPDVWGDRPMWGNHWGISRHGLTWHMFFGKACGALPDGTIAGVAQADGSLSAMRGADKNGVLALLRSAAKMEQIQTWATTFNVKLTPTVLENKNKIAKLAGLIRTYFNLGGYHIQFNIIDRETLIKAKENPEEFRDLLVRVAAYTANFVNLSPEVQDEIIERTWYEEL